MDFLQDLQFPPWQTLAVITGLPLGLSLYLAAAAEFIARGKPVLSGDDIERPEVTVAAA